MRLLTVLFAGLLILIQYPLWLGDGGWLRVWERERKLAKQVETNAALRMRNASLDAEVRDLRSGTAAIEERARFELGMVKTDEIFVQILDPKAAGPQPPTSAATASTAASPANPAPAAVPAGTPAIGVSVKPKR